jgi:hypothetical protein
MATSSPSQTGATILCVGASLGLGARMVLALCVALLLSLGNVARHVLRQRLDGTALEA